MYSAHYLDCPRCTGEVVWLASAPFGIHGMCDQCDAVWDVTTGGLVDDDGVQLESPDGHACPVCGSRLEDVRDVTPPAHAGPAVVGGDCATCDDFRQVSEGHAGIA